jgi:hypothetical protein
MGFVEEISLRREVASTRDRRSMIEKSEKWRGIRRMSHSNWVVVLSNGSRGGEERRAEVWSKAISLESRKC